jgi:hypothetical protein
VKPGILTRESYRDREGPERTGSITGGKSIRGCVAWAKSSDVNACGAVIAALDRPDPQCDSRLKVEQPGQGDDTRRWGPPFLEDGSGDSAYYLCANRNKRSVAINMADPRGADLIRKMAADVDIVVENFRVGGLTKYGLDYATLSTINPRLIYCSITGFGQDGPYKDRGGYDFLVQGMSGLMSVTGRPDEEPGGGPMKVGIPTPCWRRWEKRSRSGAPMICSPRWRPSNCRADA